MLMHHHSYEHDHSVLLGQHGVERMPMGQRYLVRMQMEQQEHDDVIHRHRGALGTVHYGEWSVGLLPMGEWDHEGMPLE
jgi:hypothetical protein